MTDRWLNLTITIVSSGLLVTVLQSIGKAWKSMKSAAHVRETAVQKAEREAAEWEIALRRTRRMAIDAGVPAEDLPLGPGENPSWKE